jgi:uncharacterized repeat protein (TIGR02543 family)
VNNGTVTLYAQWTANTYTVTYYENANGDFVGGMPSTNPITVTHGATISQPPNPSRDGYTFSGWYREAAGTNAWNFASNTVTADTPLYAKWTQNTYTVTYNANANGENVTGMPSPNPVLNVPHGTAISQPPSIPIRTGYTFDGWHREAAGTTAWNFTSDTVTENRILYAKWIANTYTVTYYPNANCDIVGGMPSPNPVLNVPHGTTISQPSPNPSRDGYTFSGWYREAAGTTAWIFTSDTVTANTPLYAKWKANTYTVTYHENANGDSVTDMPMPNPVTDVPHGTTISQPSPNPSRYGYTFSGWYRQAAGTTAWNFASNTVTADTPLYAKWTQNTYTVTYNANANGDNVTGMPSPNPVLNVPHGTAISQPPTNPSRTDYTFGGWYKEATGTTAWNFATDTVIDNTPLYAKWINIYTVTFNSNGGSSVTPQKVDSGKMATEPTGPTRSGYTFAGWYSNSGMTTPYVFSTPVTKDITLHAKWTFTVSGNIYLDVSGNLAIGATVQLILPNWDDLNAPYDLNVTSITDANGYYEFPSTPLDIGKGYVIIASFPGYTSNAISVDDKLVINLTLLNSGPETRGASQNLNLKQLLLPLKK